MEQIKDNFIKKGLTPNQVQNYETVFGAEQVKVGVITERYPEEQEDGSLLMIPKVEGVDIHNERTRIHQNTYDKATGRSSSPWFILRLETGERGWYPGATTYGKVYTATELYTEPFIGTGEIIPANTEVKILTTLDDSILKATHGWYYINYNNNNYYIIKENILKKDISYRDQ